MVCEKCNQEIDSVKCQGCGETVLRLGSHCYQCGTELNTSNQVGTEESDESDFSKRVLCSDGTCIGVINEEGICKVCGKPYTADA
jgi:hypothetical protein